MNLAQPDTLALGLRLLSPLVALALTGCGDDFVAFSDPPLVSAGAGAGVAGGSASVTSASGGTAAEAGGGSASGVMVTGLTPSGGSMSNMTAGAAGVETVSAGAGGGPGGSGAGAAGGPGGGGGAGGAGGGGGAGGRLVNPTTESFDLIDDVEGPFPQLPLRQGRNGGWFGVHDASLGQMTAPRAVALQPARGTSYFAAGISGGGFTDWGAQLGVALKSPASGYDASNYCGLRFVAKGSGAGWSLLVSDRLSVPEGGVCVEGSSDPEQGCYNYVGKSLGVSSGWQEIMVRFDELRLVENPDSARRLDRTALYDIVFNFYDPDGGAFELLVDDLSFIEKNSSDCQ